MESEFEQARSQREWLGVATLTAIGLGLRLWPIGRLGLSHFDEGVYALAAQWSLLPKGLAGLDPSLIPYAPPGYPILGGLAYWLLGRSDGAMIAISQIAGTATIPVAAWLGRRTFGRGAGFASAAFCAFSGPHIAFSRMALTDASFLLAWLLAVGAGMRFLERPNAVRAIVMGLAVGLAQEFKYNGWLTGGIVVGSALLGILTRSDERKLASIARTFGWGIMAAGIAWLVVWPWFRFVEGHGGYSALLRHQRSYLGEIGDWGSHFRTQFEQGIALSGGWSLVLLSVSMACLGPAIAAGFRRTSAVETSQLGRCLMLAAGSCLVASGFVVLPFLLGVLLLPWLLGMGPARVWELFGPPRPRARVVGFWWLTLGLMTPLYHPYARLWLPFQAAHWLLLGWLVADGLPTIFARLHRLGGSGPWPREVSGLQAMLRVAIFFGLAVVPPWWFVSRSLGRPQPGLLAPSDSLYRATIKVAELLPEHVKTLRFLGRPSLRFYLVTRISLESLADSDALSKSGDPSVWALVDSTILVSEPGRNPIERFADRWEVVETVPTNPNLPTRLDLDPNAARDISADRSYPLWLLRPRTSKATR